MSEIAVMTINGAKRVLNGGRHAALRAARYPRDDRHQVRMRSRRLRILPVLSKTAKRVRSCQVAASEAKDRSFTTIEGLSKEVSHPCQRAWLEEDVAQSRLLSAGNDPDRCSLLR